MKGHAPVLLQRSPTAAGAALAGAVALAVRLPGALGDSLWGDEIPSARALSQPHLGGVFTQVRLRESTPPAWYVLGWAVHRIGGPLHDVRLVSVACSAGVAALAVVFASRLMPAWAATVAGLLVALGLQFVVHGRELRAYGLLLLVVVAFAALLDAAAARPDAARLTALAACVAVGTLTHYFFFFTLACGCLWVVGSTKGARPRLVAALVAGALPFLGWLPDFRAQLATGHTDWIGGFDPLKLAYLPSAFFADVGLLYHQAASPSHGAADLILRPAFLAALAVASLRLARSSPRGRLCVFLAAGPFLLTAVASLLGARIVDVRNLLVIAPFVSVLVAYAVAQVPRRFAFGAAGGVAALAIASCLQARAWRPLPFERLARELVAQGWQSDEPIAVYGAVTPFPHPNEYVPPALGWYLPGHPRLVVSSGVESGCPDLYVIASETVSRLGGAGRLAARRLPTGAHYLRTRRHPTCELVNGRSRLARARARGARRCPRRLALGRPLRRRS